MPAGEQIGAGGMVVGVVGGSQADDDVEHGCASVAGGCWSYMVAVPKRWLERKIDPKDSLRNTESPIGNLARSVENERQ